MKSVVNVVVGFIVGSMLVGAGVAGAQDNGAAARKILEANKDAVVKVKVVTQTSVVFNGKEAQSTEAKTEITGTVMDSSGLMLVSLSAVDPSRMMDSFMSMAGGEAGGFKMENKVRLKDVKIILPDETELDASVVLRDKDLDIAFVRPKQKPAKPLAALDLQKSSTPSIFDEAIAVSRLGKVANHVPALYATRINAIVQKPLTFYVPQTTGGEGVEHLGMPVFSLDGRVIGVTLLRIAPASGGGGGMAAMMGGASGMGITGIVLPAAEILKAAKQATAETTQTAPAGDSAGKSAE